MKLIDKATVVAEINKRLHQLTDAAFDSMIGRNLIEIRDFLDTLEVKEVDLEKELNEYGLYYDYTSFDRKEMIDFAKHFFEFGIYSQLSWQDIRKIAEIGGEFMNSEESDNLSEEEYYTTILDKLKEKGRDYKTDRQEIRDLVQKGK